MTRADQRAVRQDDGRFGNFAFNLGDGNADLGGLNDQLHAAKPHFIASFEPDFVDGLSVHERSVGRVIIMEDDAVARQNQFAVMRRDGGVVKLKIVVCVAADMVYAQP